MSCKKCTSVTTTRDESDDVDILSTASQDRQKRRDGNRTAHGGEGKRALNSEARAALPPEDFRGSLWLHANHESVPRDHDGDGEREASERNGQ